MRSVPLMFSILLGSIVSLAAVDVHDRAVTSGSPAARQSNQRKDPREYADSLKELDAIIRSSPDLWEAYDVRANLFMQKRNWPAALQDLNSTIRLQPAFFEASWKRSIVYLHLRNYAASLKDLDALAKVTFQTQHPHELALTLSQRAWIRATCPDGSFRNGRAAIADAKKACELIKWKYADYIDTLAGACAEAGDFDSAVRYEQQAIDLNRSGKDETIQKTGNPVGDKVAVMMANKAQQSLPGYFKRLELYKQHRPYRDTK